MVGRGFPALINQTERIPAIRFERVSRANTSICAFVPAKGSGLSQPLQPTKIIAAGLNYHSHAQELNMPVPDKPVLFMKPLTALAVHGETIAYPASTQQVDFEGELALVIGKPGRNISEAQAEAHLLGYTLANDITARDLQKKDGQWTRAKGFDGFCPLGPRVVADLVPERLEIRTYLNGELKQKGSPADFIFSVLKIIAFVSEIMTLLPGDVILTGTPPGIGPMQRGDRVRVECDEIGVLENRLL